jgi:hypothetical protein
MDTTKLAVGQDVYMFNHHYPYWFCGQRGKVVEVTPKGVDVQTAGELLRFDTNNIPVFIVGQTTLVVGQDVDVAYCQRKDRRGKVVKVTPSGVEVEVADRLRFDNDGYELDVSRRDRLGFGPSPEDKFYTSLWQSAPEFGPWHLDDMPFAERTTLLEQKAQRFRKWDSMDCEHSKIGEHYYIEKCTICGCDNPNYNPTAANDRLQGKLPK